MAAAEQEAQVEPRTPSRHRRKRAVRARTIQPRDIRVQVRLSGSLGTPRHLPETTAECLPLLAAEGWCPFVSCPHHRYLDVNPRTGSIKLNFPDLEPWELVDPCAMLLASRPHILQEVADLLNLTRERARQIEEVALEKLRMQARREGAGEDEVPLIRRQLSAYLGTASLRAASLLADEGGCWTTQEVADALGLDLREAQRALGRVEGLWVKRVGKCRWEPVNVDAAPSVPGAEEA